MYVGEWGVRRGVDQRKSRWRVSDARAVEIESEGFELDPFQSIRASDMLSHAMADRMYVGI